MELALAQETVARWQFGITTVYHFLFVPITISLAFLIAGLQTAWVRTGKDKYFKATRFWGKLFLINIAMGVATGLDLTPGHRIAVVGPSGSGKTTLAQVLLRFLDPAAGQCTLAGTDVTTMSGDDVRQAVGLCAQDAHVFDSSLRENLRLARPDSTEQELWAALAAARLDTWVRALPAGLDTPVGEHGARLSGGQRQRLALARALLADFPVLVLDEPTEHLDLPTADALTTDLLAATRGRATVLITHRLTGLDQVDEILVLDHGRIVQRGSWEELTTVPGPLLRTVERERATTLSPIAVSV